MSKYGLRFDAKQFRSAFGVGALQQEMSDLYSLTDADGLCVMLLMDLPTSHCTMMELEDPTGKLISEKLYVYGGIEEVQKKALKAFRSQWKKPASVVKTFANPASGTYVALFSDGSKSVVHIGKGKDFSEKEGFACAVADHVFGGRNGFEEAFAVAMKKISYNDAGEKSPTPDKK
jgi:hypothetical protein